MVLYMLLFELLPVCMYVSTQQLAADWHLHVVSHLYFRNAVVKVIWYVTFTASNFIG